MQEDLEKLLVAGRKNTGTAQSQVAHFAKAIDALEAKYPDAASYTPGAIL